MLKKITLALTLGLTFTLASLLSLHTIQASPSKLKNPPLRGAICTPIYTTTQWKIDICPTDATITNPMTITLNGIDQGQAALIQIYYTPQGYSTMAQIAAIYANGYVKLKHLDNLDPTNPFPNAFILGPAYWSNSETYHHNPQLQHLAINTNWLPNGPLHIQINGFNHHFEVSYALKLPPPNNHQTRLHIKQLYTATNAINIPPTRQANTEGFKLVQMSSKFITDGTSCDGGQTACYHSQATRFINNHLVRQQIAFSTITPSSYIFNPPRPLGTTWLDILDSDDDDWPGNNLNMRLVLDNLPSDDTISPQGWLSATTNPDKDNLGLWLHDDSSASQNWLAGESDSISYWVLAQVEPFEPWTALNLRQGLTFADFEGNYNCFPVLPGLPITASVTAIAGYSDTALQLNYNIGNTAGNWAQIRCNFNPPLDLSAYDHLRFDWRGEKDIANSLEIGLINPGLNQEYIFARAYHHVTHRNWWGQLVIPFKFLHPWTEGSSFNPAQVSAMFISVVKNEVADVGGIGKLAVDNLNVYNVISRSVPLTIETVSQHITASTMAANWLVSQQKSNGLLKSWTEEQSCSAHTYDQALALLVFIHAKKWTEANNVVDGLTKAQKANGAWYKSYNCDDFNYNCVHCHEWEGDIAWAIYALSRYVEFGGTHPQATTAYKNGATWLSTRLDTNNGCLVIDHTEGTIDAWWAFYVAGSEYIQATQDLEMCLLNEYWDDEMGRFKGGLDWWQPYQDNQTWGAAFLRAIGEETKANRALSYAKETLRLPSEGGQFFGFDGQGGPWALWNEGTGQYIALGGLGANELLADLLAQQESNGALVGSPNYFLGGGVWISNWHGVAPTAWLYHALNGGPFDIKDTNLIPEYIYLPLIVTIQE